MAERPYHRIEESMLRHWFDRPRELVRLLAETESVLHGAWLLEMMRPGWQLETQPNGHEVSRKRRLVLTTWYDQREAIVRKLQEEHGYETIPTGIREEISGYVMHKIGTESYIIVRAVPQVMAMRIPRKVEQLEGILYGLAKTTGEMVMLTGRYAVCVYPDLTLDRRGVFPIGMKVGREFRVESIVSERQKMHKDCQWWCQRGFDVMPTRIGALQGEVTRDRKIMDRYSLVVTWTDMGVMEWKTGEEMMAEWASSRVVDSFTESEESSRRDRDVK